MNDLFGNIIDRAIERLRAFEPEEGYYLAYSGGKDSDVILDLTRRSGVKFDAHHSLTTCDPPELVRHVKTQPDVEIQRPKMTMWELIRHKKMMPCRTTRFCCNYQKETGGNGRVLMTGVRWQESNRRASRKMVEQCYRNKTKRYLHPIIDWSASDVWTYIRTRKIKYCSLYDEGFKRLGCVLCPMNSNTQQHMERWPRLCRAWERACKAVYNQSGGKIANRNFESAEEYWQWWLSRDGKYGQNEMPLFFRD